MLAFILNLLILKLVRYRTELYCCLPSPNIAGYWRHYSCVFGIGDLPKLIKQPQLFANKFDINYDSLPTLCLKNLLDERRLLESEMW